MILRSILKYETNKIVKIKNTKVGLFNRSIQLIVLVYITCYVLIYDKGYQDFDIPTSSVTTKVKGFLTDNAFLKKFGYELWDEVDVVIPSLARDSFFIMTNVILTARQKQGSCIKQQVPNISCTDVQQCKSSSTFNTGIMTGRCTEQNGGHKECELRGWCPLELDATPYSNRSLFPMVTNMTVMIKNDVTFTKFGVTKRNIMPWSQKKFITTCRYNESDVVRRLCPIFKIGTILNSVKNVEELFKLGGVVEIKIEWMCNLDHNVKYCRPTYSFSRLDDPNATLAKGFNFRLAYKYYVNNTLMRDHLKVYGIKFIISVVGKAGKFHFNNFAMNVGSGLALIEFAEIICDIILLNFHRARNKFYAVKFQMID